MKPPRFSPKQQFSKEQKISEIIECLSQEKVNLWHLRELCLLDGGLMTAELRRKAWHKLFGINPTDCHPFEKTKVCDAQQSDTINQLEDSFTDDTELISRDVGRAVYFRYPITEATRGKHSKNSNTSKYMQSGQSILTKIIISTISNVIDSGEEGRLNYYQGFHDVASVIFVNLPREPELASAILHKLASSHLRDAMMEDFSNISALLESVFYPLLQVIDVSLHDYLILRELYPTVFLTWMITLFSHDIHSEEIISRLFDAIIVSHPLMPLYLTIAILIQPNNRQKLFNANRSEAAMLHVVASNLISGIDNDDFLPTHNGFTAQDIIECALGIMKQFPPESLLQLAKHYDLGQSDILLKRCESLYLFKELKPWALSSHYYETCVLEEEDRSKYTNLSDKFPLAVTAVNASGIVKSNDRANNKGVTVKNFTDLALRTFPITSMVSST